jgi:hypothetical protein
MRFDGFYEENGIVGLKYSLELPKNIGELALAPVILA